jgi:NADH/NAD ratio-sensing transcriptional regulator Rex
VLIADSLPPLKSLDLKPNLMKIVEAFKKEMNKFLKEIQENIIKQVKEMNKTVQDVKMETEAIKKVQAEGILEMENLEKKL